MNTVTFTCIAHNACNMVGAIIVLIHLYSLMVPIMPACAYTGYWLKLF